jgi:hypothetical protein
MTQVKMKSFQALGLFLYLRVSPDRPSVLPAVTQLAQVFSESIQILEYFQDLSGISEYIIFGTADTGIFRKYSDI